MPRPSEVAMAVKAAARCFDGDRCMRDFKPFGDIAPRYRLRGHKPTTCDDCIEQSRQMIVEALEAAEKVRGLPNGEV